MAVTKMNGWRTSDRLIFVTEEDALRHEARIEVRRTVDKCTYCGEFEFDDFLAAVKDDKNLAAQLKFLVS